MSRSRFDSIYTNIEPPKKKKKKSTWLRFILVVLIVLAGIGGYIGYSVFGAGTTFYGKSKDLYLPTGITYGAMKRVLKNEGIIKNEFIFDQLATQAKLQQHIHPGKYKIKSGTSNYDLIRQLRSGRQEAIKIVINKLRTKDQLVTLLCSQLEADSTEMYQLINNSKYLSEFGLDTNTFMCAIIPDTYEFFWSTDADRTIRRLELYKQKFWNTDRTAKAKQLGLTPNEVTIVASIVDEETNKNDEKPNVASVYLNRLSYDMPLQADPTVKFALKDFGLKRILNKHLTHNSPYNTYIYTGLPPGPICTPSKPSIDAVLNAPKTNYLYFCAKADFSGYHAFATNHADHLKNAKAFHKAMNDRGIK